jgi:class 3 adenylate cyclase
VLYGEVGTARQSTFDLLGLPVVLAMQLAHLATVRSTPHLITASCIQSAQRPASSIEVGGAELAGERVRLYRLLAPGEARDVVGFPQA